ncbi:uncharacterized protein M6G45_014321 isoform 2-T2 [Spheniscus humboldti]
MLFWHGQPDHYWSSPGEMYPISGPGLLRDPPVLPYLKQEEPNGISTSQPPCPAFQYVLCAPTSPAVRHHEETLTYLNQGQSYEIRMMGSPRVDPGGEGRRMLKSVVRVVFHDRRLQYSEQQQLEGWRWSRPGDRILDIDIPLSVGILEPQIHPTLLNTVEFLWDPSRRTSVFVQVHCISTEFTLRKNGGEKGVPFRIQINTFEAGGNGDPPEHLHSASCLVKVFKVLGGGTSDPRVTGAPRCWQTPLWAWGSARCNTPGGWMREGLGARAWVHGGPSTPGVWVPQGSGCPGLWAPGVPVGCRGGGPGAALTAPGAAQGGGQEAEDGPGEGGEAAGAGAGEIPAGLREHRAGRVHPVAGCIGCTPQPPGHPGAAISSPLQAAEPGEAVCVACLRCREPLRESWRGAEPLRIPPGDAAVAAQAPLLRLRPRLRQLRRRRPAEALPQGSDPDLRSPRRHPPLQRADGQVPTSPADPLHVAGACRWGRGHRGWMLRAVPGGAPGGADGGRADREAGRAAGAARGPDPAGVSAGTLWHPHPCQRRDDQELPGRDVLHGGRHQSARPGGVPPGAAVGPGPRSCITPGKGDLLQCRSELRGDGERSPRLAPRAHPASAVRPPSVPARLDQPLVQRGERNGSQPSSPPSLSPCAGGGCIPAPFALFSIKGRSEPSSLRRLLGFGRGVPRGPAPAVGWEQPLGQAGERGRARGHPPSPESPRQPLGQHGGSPGRAGPVPPRRDGAGRGTEPRAAPAGKTR